jgi:hypothetical protein
VIVLGNKSDLDLIVKEHSGRNRLTLSIESLIGQSLSGMCDMPFTHDRDRSY